MAKALPDRVVVLYEGPWCVDCLIPLDGNGREPDPVYPWLCVVCSKKEEYRSSVQPRPTVVPEIYA